MLFKNAAAVEKQDPFETRWLGGPWTMRGKSDARKKFARYVKTKQDLEDFDSATEVYREYCAANKAWYTPMWGSTFMGVKWRDWLRPEKTGPVAVVDLTVHDTEHHCDLCVEPHDWVCTDELCTLEKTAPCAGWIAAYRARTRRA